jgi:hypothetical protein
MKSEIFGQLVPHLRFPSHELEDDFRSLPTQQETGMPFAHAETRHLIGNLLQHTSSR